MEGLLDIGADKPLRIRRRDVVGGVTLALCAPSAARAQTQSAGFTAQQLRDDLNSLVDTLIAVHPQPFAYTPADIFENGRRHVASMLRDGMDARAFHLLAAPLLASIEDGHTFLRPPVELYNEWANGGGLVFPFDVELRGRRMLVRRSLGSRSIEAGAEITAINDIPAAQIIETLLPYSIGEREAFRLSIIQGSLPMLLFLVMQFGGAYRIVYNQDGVAGLVDVVGVPIAARNSGADAQTPSPPVVSLEILRPNIAMLSVSAFEDMAQSRREYRRAFAALRANRIRDLIIDLRGNNGGDSMIGDELLSYIIDRPLAQTSRIDVKISAQIHDFYRDPTQANRRSWHYDEIMNAPVGEVLSIIEAPVTPKPEDQRFDGRVWVFTDRLTYSAAVMLASAVKDHGLGVIVGEETGGLATQFADTYHFTLANTALRVRVSHKLIVRPSGSLDRCGVIPDHEAAQGEPILSRALELIAQQRVR